MKRRCCVLAVGRKNTAAVGDVERPEATRRRSTEGDEHETARMSAMTVVRLREDEDSMTILHTR